MIVLTATSTSFATKSGLRLATRSIKSDFVILLFNYEFVLGSISVLEKQVNRASVDAELTTRPIAH